MNLVVLEFMIIMIYTFGRRLLLACCLAEFLNLRHFNKQGTNNLI